MSTTILPDIYRHFARKSTVSRNVKISPKNVPLCNSTFSLDSNSQVTSLTFNRVRSEVKLGSDAQEKQTVLILPDNETEEMIVEQTNEEIISDIIEQIQQQIPDDFTDQKGTSNKRRSISIDIQTVTDSILNRLDVNDNESSSTTDNNQMNDDTNESLNEDSSILSQLHTDEDTREMEKSTSDIHPPLCACQCHQITSDSAIVTTENDYFQFEQALQQSRQEEEQEKSINNNRLLQTLKRQHQELLNFYQKQLNMNKVDRAQQTIQINQHDSQIQTDLTTNQQQIPKPNVFFQFNGTSPLVPARMLSTPIMRPYSSFITPIRTTGPSLQQLIPCLSTTGPATGITLTNKKIVTNTIIHTQPPPLVTKPHDIVDLTEEEEDYSNRLSKEKTPFTRSEYSAAPPSTAATARTRIDQAIRPTNSLVLSQTFLPRPLPEHNPCDYSIARPQLSIAYDNTTVRLTWNLAATPMEAIQNYEIYAYKQNATTSSSGWKKIGSVNSMRLPMVVTLKEFQCNCHYAFAVRGVSINNTIGPFCELKTVFTGNTPFDPLNTNQLLNVTL
ncbi:unnamed protein product [Rotaria magnacalcarata]|uniref:Fibronectin type-III domain-containing protein n=1 Tax=Rotaria magnacalcarata TaxID=392030 RepID=A0A814Y7M2_9BILA|nr:unnamed protein product [Rotaria magnacalcarata]CAF1679111.1 unnamed protein product [Rotaria magnacalcarata]CAF2131696.1 unnamed protein product [Rotaria magnacalcarata]